MECIINLLPVGWFIEEDCTCQLARSNPYLTGHAGSKTNLKAPISQPKRSTNFCHDPKNIS